MSLRSTVSLFSMVSLFVASVQLCSAANWHVDVGGANTYGDGYGGSYDTPILMFAPSTLTINVGDTVTFHNLGGAAHNVHADDNSFRCANGCDGQGGDGTPSSTTWTSVVTFNTPGMINFHCDVHGSMGMSGSIQVNSVAVAGPAITGATSGSWFDGSIRPWLFDPGGAAKHLHRVLVRVHTRRNTAGMGTGIGNVRHDEQQRDGGSVATGRSEIPAEFRSDGIDHDRLGVADVHVHRLQPRHDELGFESAFVRQWNVADHENHRRRRTQLYKLTAYA